MFHPVCRYQFSHSGWVEFVHYLLNERSLITNEKAKCCKGVRSEKVLRGLQIWKFNGLKRPKFKMKGLDAVTVQ